VLDAVARVKKLSNYTQVIAGNVATREGAQALIDAGADAVKIGIGPGSICTTAWWRASACAAHRHPRGAEACRAAGVPAIGDGGIKSRAISPRAIAAGADCAMIGSLLAGTDEARVKCCSTRALLQVVPRHGLDRRHGARLGDATSRGGREQLKLVPEGIEGACPTRGGRQHHSTSWSRLRAAMGYTGQPTIRDLQPSGSSAHHRLGPGAKAMWHDVASSARPRTSRDM